jgi:hypothetical protein
MSDWTTQRVDLSLDLGIKSSRSVGRVILLAALVLFLAEAALQVRSQVRTGRSVWSLLSSTSMYVVDADLGIRLLRPSAEIGGRQTSIRTNRLGLRGEDIPTQSAAHEWRVALLGASTIMSPFAASNDATAAAILEGELRADREPEKVTVINAGIGGLKVREQVVLLSDRLLPLNISLLAWYPGMNDITCQSPGESARESRVRLPVPEWPAWLLSYDLLVKNSSWIRRSRVSSNQRLVPAFEPSKLRSDLEAGLRVAKTAGIPVVLITSAASFDSGMTEVELRRRSAAALEHRPCFSAREFADAFDTFNAVLREVAMTHGVGLVDASQALGTDPELYSDATHFTLKGEQRLAELLRQALRNYPALTSSQQ